MVNLSIIENAEYYPIGINILKISIILFVSFMLIANFNSYFDSIPDSFEYGVLAKRIANGEWTIEGEFLKSEKIDGFVLEGFRESAQGTIPKPYPGFPSLASVLHQILGDYGLFYFGPISTILLIIASERISTKLFGATVGFFVLLFMATNEAVFYVGQHLLTDTVFALFLIIGIFFLIKFFQVGKINHIVYSSILFAACAFLRVNGFIFLPIELIIVYSFLKINKISNNTTQQKIKSKTKMKIFVIILIPWIVVAGFYIGYNLFFYESPIGPYKNSLDRNFIESTEDSNEKLSVNYGNNFLKYSSFLIPHPLNRLPELSQDYDKVTEAGYPFIGKLLQNVSPFFENENKFLIGIFSIIIIIVSLIVSIFKKKKTLEIVVLASFTISFLGLYSTLPDYIGTARYMVPVVPVFSIMISFLIVSFLKSEGKPSRIKLRLSLKISLVIILTIFFIIAFYSSEPLQIIKNNSEFKNPQKIVEDYYLDKNELSKNSIVISANTHKVLDYSNAIPFTSFERNKVRVGLDSTDFNENHANQLKKAIKNGFEIYIFKDPFFPEEKIYYKSIADHGEFILSDFSDSFCKLNIINDETQNTDKACL